VYLGRQVPTFWGSIRSSRSGYYSEDGCTIFLRNLLRLTLYLPPRRHHKYGGNMFHSASTLSTKLHGVISMKLLIFITMFMRTSKIISLNFGFGFVELCLAFEEKGNNNFKKELLCCYHGARFRILSERLTGN
jgi:hypothetical protein